MQNYWVYDLNMKQGITQFINEQIYLKSDNQITHEYNKNIKYYNNFGYNEGIDYLTNKNYNQLKFYPNKIQIYNINFGGALKDKYMFCVSSNIGKIAFNITAYYDEKQINYYIHYTKINTCNY